MGAIRRSMGRVAMVAGAAMTISGAAVTPAQAAGIEYYVGYECDGEIGMVPPAACAWLNVDHTNNRIRAYARATMSAGYGDVAVRYIRIQRWNGNVWSDVPGTMVNDLDGWHQPGDEAASNLMSCLGPGMFRAAAHWTVQGDYNFDRVIISGSFEFGQAYNC